MRLKSSRKPLRLADFTEAIRREPRLPDIHGHRGVLLLARGDYKQAAADLTEAIRRDPKETQLYTYRGQALKRLGRREGAAADFTAGVQATARSGPDYVARAYARQGRGDYRAAARDFEMAKRTLRREPGLLNALAWLRATCPDASVRNGPAAVRDATLACELTKWRQAALIDTLAAAYAERGDFERARETQKQALSVVRSGESRAELEAHLRLFEAGKPVRDPSPGRE